MFYGQESTMDKDATVCHSRNANCLSFVFLHRIILLIKETQCHGCTKTIFTGEGSWLKTLSDLQECDCERQHILVELNGLAS